MIAKKNQKRTSAPAANDSRKQKESKPIKNTNPKIKAYAA